MRLNCVLVKDVNGEEEKLYNILIKLCSRIKTNEKNKKIFRKMEAPRMCEL